MTNTVILGAARTPIGSFMGALSTVTSPQLGAFAIKGAYERAGINPDIVNEVIMGCVLTSGLGQSPARQALLAAGLSEKTAALTIGKVCGSGLRSIMLADQIIRAGDADVIIAGGMESMSQSPYLLPKVRQGLRMGHSQIQDVMIHDGLWDAYHHVHMGNCAEVCATDLQISRDAQDDFAAESYKRALESIEKGYFNDEIVPVSVPQKKGDAVLVHVDEEPGKGKISKLSQLKPAFEKTGTVTAGNASSINDGAAAVVLMNEHRAKSLGLAPMARIVSHAQSSREPQWFTMAPADAMEQVLQKTKLSVDDIDLWEVNEAFSVVALANNAKLQIPDHKVNVHGGAVALGHPIGASGARILVTLLYALKKYGKRRGLASLCIGGGEAVAMVIESLG